VPQSPTETNHHSTNEQTRGELIVSLRPKRNPPKRGGTQPRKKIPPISKHMIAGKTHSEILAMTKVARYRWYKKISPEEKEASMRMMEIERRAKISKNNPMKRPEQRDRMREFMLGEYNPMYGRTGEKGPGWKGGVSFEPYCLAFNEERKEHIRNLGSRTCTICGKSTLQNIGKNRYWLGRLDIDHLDENKMQGCGDWEWRLTPLCTSCHSRMRTNKKEIPRHLLLQLLLLNNKRHQTNFIFEEVEDMIATIETKE
jgi:hypothetical protein